MTAQERAQTAYELKATGQCNCTQAVLMALKDKLGKEDDYLMDAASGFAAGMGCMESTCGALIGAVIAAGIIKEGNGTPKISKNLVADFKEMCGDTICKNLKGAQTGKVLCQCPDCCKNAVLALSKQIEL